MAILSSNDCREFRVARTPELESRGYPCLFSVALDGHTIQRVTKSLTDNVLKQHYIDALSNADQLVVVPDGADTLVQTK